MWDVHTKGKAVVSNGPRERCEADVAALHGYGLWATLRGIDDGRVRACGGGAVTVDPLQIFGSCSPRSRSSSWS